MTPFSGSWMSSKGAVTMLDELMEFAEFFLAVVVPSALVSVVATLAFFGVACLFGH